MSYRQEQQYATLDLLARRRGHRIEDILRDQDRLIEWVECELDAAKQRAELSQNQSNP